MTDYLLNSPLIVTILEFRNLTVQSTGEQAIIIRYMNPQTRCVENIVNTASPEVSRQVNLVRAVPEIPCDTVRSNVLGS